MTAMLEAVALLNEQARILDEQAAAMRVEGYVRSVSEIVESTQQTAKDNDAILEWLDEVMN